MKEVCNFCGEPVDSRGRGSVYVGYFTLCEPCFREQEEELSREHGGKFLWKSRGDFLGLGWKGPEDGERWAELNPRETREYLDASPERWREFLERTNTG